MQVLPGCADGPAAAPPEGGWPWNAKPCASAAVGQQCFTTCIWPAYDGSGYYVTCLPDGSWSGPGGFCFPRSCSGSPGPDFLPTPNAPAGSKGWSADCAGRANGGTCRAACDGLNSFFGQGYTAVCQAGQWTVQPGAGCNVCASSQAFAIKGGSLANGGIFGFPYAILPTNDGASVLVADSQGNRVTRYSARDLSYEGQWTGLNTISGLAQAHGTNGNVYVAGYANGALRELAYPSGNLVRAPNVGLFYQQLAVDSAGMLWAGNYNDGVLKCWDPASSFTVLKTFQAPDGVNGRFSPIGVAIDPRTGNVLASDYDNGRVVAFSSDGTFLREVITDFPAYTTAGLAVDAAGNIYLPIYDEIGGLFKYDSNGKLLAKYGGALRYPWAVSVGADGVVWVTEEINGARKITCM
ncbi:hypothetical protein OEZ86_004670 [Tetradesmus obliquus]|nr:hypothetical protein OEZ86_004670 [Tetradesmus obliquus]